MNESGIYSFVELGVVLSLAVSMPHVPVLQELPAVDALARRAPWE